MEENKNDIKIVPTETTENNQEKKRNSLKKRIRRFFRLFCFKCFVQKSNCEFCNNCKITINVSTSVV